MLSLDIAQLPPDIASMFMLRAADAVPLQWHECANRRGKNTLDDIDDVRLLAGTPITNDVMGAVMRSWLYVWNGYFEDAIMYAQCAPEQERDYIAGFSERMQGRYDDAKTILQKVGDHPTSEQLTKVTLEEIATTTNPFIQRFKKSLEENQKWDHFLFCDLFELAQAGSLGIAGEQLVSNLQCKEFELLFTHCYYQATGVRLASVKREDPSKIPPRPKKNRESKKSSRKVPVKEEFPKNDPKAKSGKGKSDKSQVDPGKPQGSDKKPDPKAPIVLACPHCQTKLSFPPSVRGKQLKCPRCQNRFGAPEPEDSEDNGEQKPPPFFRIICPHCRQVLTVKEEERGQKHGCQYCHCAFMVPKKKPVATAPNPEA